MQEQEKVIKEGDRLLQKSIRHTSFSLFGFIFGEGLGLIISIILARYLGATTFGVYGLGLTILNIAVLIGALGFPSTVSRFIPVYFKEKKFFNLKGLLIQAISLPLFAGLALEFLLYILAVPIALKIFKAPLLIPALRFFSVILPLQIIMDTTAGITVGFETAKFDILSRRIVKQAVNLIFVGLAYFAGLNLTNAIGAYGLAILAALIVNIGGIRKIFPELFRKDIKPVFETRRILKFSFDMLFLGILGIFLSWTDIIMVGYFLPEAQVGIYKAIVQICMLIVVLLGAFSVILKPMISSLFCSGKYYQLENLLQTITKWVFSFSFLAFILILLSPNEFLRLFGKDFVQGRLALITLACGQLINAGVGPTGLTLMMSGKEKIEVYNVIGISSLNIVLNIILIPRLGILGAAIGSSISIALINIVRLFEVWKILGIKIITSKFFKPLLAGLFSLIIGYSFRAFLANLNLNFFILLVNISAATTVAFALTLFFLGLDREDRLWLRVLVEKLIKKE